MGAICPTVLAATVDEYQEQMDAIASFADRVQVDLGDGVFTTKTVAVSDAWWPEGTTADIHLMHQDPFEAVTALVEKKPHMIILHAESTGDLAGMFTYIQEHGVLAGVALLQPTGVETISSYIERIDHVLIFSGSLGSFGGKADLSLLGKVPLIRSLNPEIEIGWDGGANIENVFSLSKGGIDVINVGGAIQKATHPENAFRALQRQVYD